MGHPRASKSHKRAALLFILHYRVPLGECKTSLCAVLYYYYFIFIVVLFFETASVDQFCVLLLLDFPNMGYYTFFFNQKNPAK